MYRVGRIVLAAPEGGAVLALVLFAALGIPAQERSAVREMNRPAAPEQVLAWQLEGLTQEEIRDELRSRGLTEYPEVALLSALSAAGADAETIQAMRHTGAPRKLWKLGLRLPRTTDYLYEIAGAIMWNDHAAALNAIEKAAQQQPENAEVHLIFANIMQNQRDWIQAYAEATRAVELDAQWPYGHAMRSMICYRSRLTDCAAREARIFMTFRPQDARAYVALGRALELAGNFAESVAAYERAKELPGRDSAVYEGIARVYAQTGQLERAEAALQQGIQLEANDAPEYSCELAEVYMADGRAQKAIDVLRDAKEKNPERLDVLITLGGVYEAVRQYPAAIREYREVLAAAPDFEPARDKLAGALRAAGRSEEARQLFLEPEVGPNVMKPQ